MFALYRLDLEDGKYTILLQEGLGKFSFEALRHGKSWRDLVGDNLVFALVSRIRELEATLNDACEEIKELEGSLDDAYYEEPSCSDEFDERIRCNEDDK
ncbi:hypothetical protein Dhaf_2702 [Desulfitobacterium hafniense DCB-2]|uniref:Uncharacterized protein n=1 Tax=Desulfitobacterium hafniense (strain DSM 10664 / DCB-2) TaxID=272564 RepID=B8FWB6_DESHD|nr:hypothetical protein [Desulfitobacterium hafniense]ACL20728.1 hypothetical protein Dhaf_2702 [Desulfitobacterium hafniense DCB-2]